MSRKENRKKRKLPSGNKSLTKKNISPNKFPIDTGSEFMKALKFHQSGQLHKAEEIYKRILETNPNHSESLHLLGIIAHQSNKYDIAVALINKAIQCNPGNSIYFNNLGLVFKDQGKPDEAISSYQKALEIKPDFSEAYSELFHQFQRTCAWQKLEGMTTRLDEITTKALDKGIKPTESPFVNLARGADMSRNFAISKSRSCNIDRAMSSLKINFSFDGRESRKTKIVIGYLSNDFRNHPMAHLTLSLYGLHNRDEFKVFCGYKRETNLLKKT